MKKNILKFVFFLFAITFFSGCNADTFMKTFLNKTAPKEDDEFARRYLGILKTNNLDRAIELLSPEVKESNIKSKIQAIIPLLKKGEPVSIEMVGCNVVYSVYKRISYFTYQYQFKDSWLVVDVIVENIEGKQQILGINVNPIPASLKEINAFTFAGKRTVNYIFLGIAIIVSLVILYSFILCKKTKMRKKWLWIILIFCGVTSLRLNWTTGQIIFQPLTGNLEIFLGFSIVRQGLYAPWILSTYFPLGAILFLIKRKKLQINT